MNEHHEKNVMDKDIEGIIGQHPQSRFLRPIDTARVLKRLMWYEFECSRMAFGWIPAVSDYDAKTKLGRFAYVHVQNTKHYYERLKELPGTVSEKDGAPPLVREVFERIAMAPDEEAFYIGYRFLAAQILEECMQLKHALDPVLDAPTMDKIKYVLLEKDELSEWLKDRTQFANTDQELQLEGFQEWKNYVVAVWQLFKEGERSNKAVDAVNWPIHPTDAPAGPVPPESTLDPEFPPYTAKPQYEKAYSDPDMSPLHDNIKQMHYINATEIGAAESLCYLYYGVQHMPLQFYFDAARHLWDEIRHSQMGVRRLRQFGYSTKQFKFFRGGPGLSMDQLKKEFFPDMYAGLTMVAEPCSFIKKRKSAEKFWEFGDGLSAIHCEFDMVDERMHVDFGKTWGPELYQQIGEMVTALEMSEKARIRRIEKLGEVTSPEEIKKIVKNFPGFCGLSTVELEYDKY